MFCFLVSVALSGSQESMLPGSCLIGNACTERWSVEKDSDWQREKTTKFFKKKS